MSVSKSWITTLFALAVIVAGAKFAEATCTPYDLWVEFLASPRGIDETQPRFSWKLRSGVNDETQSAYRIVVQQVAPANQPMWDSGKREGNVVLVPYEGTPLQPQSRYEWKVTVWNRDGKQYVTEKSEFTTGLFATPKDANPWKGVWIGLDEFEHNSNGATSPTLSLDGAEWIWTSADAANNAPIGKATFRKSFASSGKVVKAEIAFAADNGFTATLNGKNVGSGTNFKSAQIIDVTPEIVDGKNTIVIEVANEGDKPNPAGLLGVVRIELANGDVLATKTDSTWKCNDGTDAAWLAPNFDDKGWKDAAKLADLGHGPWGNIQVGTTYPSPPARYLQKTFTAKKAGHATIYIAGLGYYEVFLNGKKVGDHLLDPVLTDYDKRVPYVTYDVDVKQGDNILRVVLGNGRYHAPRITEPTTTRTFGFPKMLFQMEIANADGTKETIVSDETWELSTDGPIRDNNDYDGEIYDARKDVTTFKGTAKKVDAPKGKLVAQMMPPMRAVETFSPLFVKQVKPGVWVFDFGVNLVGNCTLHVPNGLPAGTKLTLRHSETLQHEGDDAGMLYVANLRGAKCRDIYITNGKPNQVYAPTFTYHGFRYAELTGLPAGVEPNSQTLTARAINTDMAKVGTFTTSNKTINAIVKNISRGTQGNYLSIPTDCPQRDERQGWQGDRAAESKGEMFMFDNAALYSKWLIDIEDAQQENGNLSDVSPNFWPLYGSNVTWPSAFTIIPESLYVMYGDTRPIERHYEGMKRWLIDHLGQFVKDGIIEKDNYGDWCVPPERADLIHSQDPARQTSKAILATAYYIHNLDLLASYARMLKKDSEAAEFTAKATEMRKAFNEKFLDAAAGKYDNGTQTSCVLPLYFGIVPEESREKVFATLVNNIDNVTDRHIGTGLIGGQWLNRVLSDNGRADLSYTFATNTSYPSWGYMIENGATTIWELWNGNTADPAMNSGNHVMLVGDLTIWFYEYLAGIKADPSRPGFEHLIMVPHVVGDLTMVDATYDSVRGEIKSRWERHGKSFVWNVTLPAGTTATVTLPDGTTREIGSGTHKLQCELK
ncbi:MAG: family 78 glycoside hydrolase catalytic domain [Thermoguttaceae bacterium]